MPGSFGEWVVVLLIVLVVFGASRLPQIGESVGKAVKNLKRGLESDDDIDVTPRDRQVEKRSSAESVKDKAGFADAEVIEEKS